MSPPFSKTCCLQDSPANHAITRASIAEKSATQNSAFSLGINAVLIKLKGWELLFKGSKTGSYLTIEENENGSVPVVIWEVTPSEEKALDRYEGYPAFYYKKDIKLQYKGIRTGKQRTINAFAYIMHEDRPIGVPSIYYMKTCLDGYDTLYFDKQILLNAYKNSMEMCENEK